jgi:hypothetical protein
VRVPVALLAMLTLGDGIQLQRADVPAVVLLALVPGLFALLVYYRGLRRTTASAATLAELAFPVTALIVNAFAFDTILTRSQLAGAALLSGTVVTLAMADRRGGGAAVGVDSRPARSEWAVGQTASTSAQPRLPTDGLGCASGERASTRALRRGDRPTSRTTS